MNLKHFEKTKTALNKLAIKNNKSSLKFCETTNCRNRIHKVIVTETKQNKYCFSCNENVSNFVFQILKNKI